MPVSILDFTNIAEAYERVLVPAIFRPWAGYLLERVGVDQGDSVLDVATGTGVVARLARDRVRDWGRVVGVDTNRGMLAVASALDGRIDWRLGDATALPIAADERFDVVTCQHGLQLFADRAGAAAEMRRALAPGGRLIVSTWRPLEEIPFLLELHRVAEARLGPVADTRHAFGDDHALAALLMGAGFEDVRVEVVTRTVRLPATGPFLRMNATAIVGMSARGRAMSAEERAVVADAIVQESEALVKGYRVGGEVDFRMGANVATGRGVA